MSEFNKYSTDGGATFIDVEDSNAVHWGDQSKGYVGKNLLRPTINDPTKSDSGVSWSFNADNSITINGIKTTGSTFINYVEALGSTQYATWDLYLEAGTYVLSGCESPFEYIMLTDANNNELASDVGSGKTFTLAQDFHGCKILIKLPQNTQVTNKTLYPMLRKASIPDSTYEPWCMSNRELTEAVTPTNQSMSALVGTLNTGNSTLRKCGKIVALSAQLSGVTATKNTWTNVIELDSASTPSVAYQGILYSPAGFGQFKVNTNGKIQIYPYSDLTNSNLFLNATYMI